MSVAPTQFIRSASLIVAADTKGLDLSDLHFTFEVRQSDVQTPNTLLVRCFNMKEETVQKIWGTQGALSEFTRVILQAGYRDGIKGVIFDGTIKQLRRGKSSGTDTFLDILGGSFDLPYNFGLVNKTLAGPTAPADQLKAIADGLQQYGVINEAQVTTGGILPRGKVLFALGRDELRNLGYTTGTTFFFEGSTIKNVPLTGYLPGEVVIINSQTGMIGMPEVTQNGITLTTLLNPKVRIGTRIQINEKDLNRVRIVNREASGPNAEALALFASEAADGIYRIVVHEMEGDTRGTPWYSRLTALALDQSAQPDLSVKRYG